MPTKRRRSTDGESDGEDDTAVEQPVNDVHATAAEETAASPPAPVKNKRGRPPGSKNKKSKATAGASGTEGDNAAGPSTAPPKRPRGRPRKPRTEEELAAEAAKALLPKRPRGRPPKKPKLDQPTITAPDAPVPAKNHTVHA